MTYLRPFFRRFSLISPFIIGLKRCGQRHSKALDVLFPLVPKKYRKNNFFIGQNHQNTKRGFLWITLYIYINALNVRINRGVSSEQDFYMYVLFFMGGGGHGGIKVWKWIIWRRQGVCMSPTTTPEHMHDPRVFLNLIKTDRSNSYFTY